MEIPTDEQIDQWQNYAVRAVSLALSGANPERLREFVLKLRPAFRAMFERDDGVALPDFPHPITTIRLSGAITPRTRGHGHAGPSTGRVRR